MCQRLLKVLSITLLFYLTACSSDKSPDTKNANKKSPDAVYRKVDNAKNSLTWQGLYQGIFPCSNCEGIATALKLNADMTYTLRTRELGREDKDKKSEGRFSWIDNAHIQLTADGQSRTFAVGRDFLQLVEPSGKSLPAKNPKAFVLEKTD
ncbi:MAG: copper resistance protein NlpE N-terminal domain-containing protein [Cardiobacteriaceae bacterium]|nr:copper resistance protein NlpE N-terminal domain-containing protein [Cardiobacteriaceae bacterium]